MAAKTATAEAPGMVPFPAEFPADPADRDEMIALMTREWDEHLARVTELYRRAKEKQARSRGSICWEGFRDFCRMAELPVPGERDRRGWNETGKAPEMTIPDGGFQSEHYDWLTAEGLAAARAARIAAWKKQMASFRQQVMSYHHSGYITMQTVTKTFADAGLEAPVTVASASFSGSVDLPQGDPASSTELSRKIREAIEAVFPDGNIKARGGIRVSTSKTVK